MSQHRFHTNVQWYNTRVAIWGAVFLVLVGVILLAARSQFNVFWSLLGIAAVIVVVAMIRDRSNRCSYLVDGEQLILRRTGERTEIPLVSILDASLIDRKSARDYYRAMTSDRGLNRARKRAIKREFLRYCTVEVGLSAFHLGLGEKVSKARYDLVLIRTKDHGVRLLSPVYNQDLVTALTGPTFKRS